MRVLVIGAGGVGAAAAAVAARRDFFERMILVDVDATRAQAAADRVGDPSFQRPPPSTRPTRWRSRRSPAPRTRT